MNTVLDELRRARETAGLSLADVADATLISIENLRALEEDRMGNLPAPYVRAFIREYAAAVGLDPDNIMTNYDRGGAEAVPVLPESPAQKQPTAATSTALSGLSGDSRNRMMIIVSSVVIVVLAIVFLWNPFSSRLVTVHERPFEDVVRENERRAFPPPDTLAAPLIARSDSLTLVGAAADSVWLRMMVDDVGPRELFLRPGARMKWRAKERVLFLIIGNPRALELTLNGKPLESLGDRGRVALRVAVGRSGILPADSLRH